MTEIDNPHDKFFKKVFSGRETAAEFLQNYLPSDMVRLLDLESLEYTKDSFVDKHLKEYFSDLLFRAYFKDGSPGYVYILFEHKSYQEPLTAFHILRYMVKIWDLLLKDKEKPGFPVIIPLVLYHGETAWRAGLNFRDLFDYPEEIESVIPDFQYLLWDASGYSDEEIKGRAILRVALLLLKYIFREDLRDRFPEILGLLRGLSERRTGLDYIEVILRYIISAAPKDNINYEDIKAAVDESLPHIGGEIMPTIADSLIEQGVQQGVQQGMQKGMQQGMQQGILQNAREAVIDILEVRFEVVPQSILKRLNEISDPSILKILHRKVVKVKSLDEFGRIIDLTMK